MWPGATFLEGYAISQYFAAFDFCLSGADIDAFHDAVGHCMPSIFVTTGHTSEASATKRAAFAEGAGVGLHADEGKLDQLPHMLSVLTNAKARDYLRENCRGLRRANWAEDAARALEALING
jgi:hypothetical protein